ncbi:MAG: YceI family protein [Actinobacteria bacterium]|nr:YceI family protein [Actinomycetota bacterium]
MGPPLNRSVIAWALGALLVGAAGLVGWLYFAGGSGEPTAELTTPTIATTSTTSTTEGKVEETTTTGAESAEIAFVIDQERSQARFEVGEELRGNPNQVVGFTNAVAGQVVVDPANPETAQISEILINARTFMTDDANRDRAIRGPVILNSASDEFELITFQPTSIDGLDEPVGVGEETRFTVSGDLTIKGVTQEATFDVTATLVDANTIEGIAETVVERSDFGIGIPNVPGVANVSEEVTLALVFVAVASE